MNLRLLLAVVGLGAGIPVARAGEPGRVAPDGTIVQIEGQTAYVDVGAARGLYRGMVLQVLRTVSARHPVSGESLTDHFPLGTMTVEQVGRVLSYGRVDPAITSLVKVGDVVGLPNVPAAAHAAPPSHGQPAAPDPAAAELSRIWAITVGQPLADRIRILEEYQSGHPESRFAQAVAAEIAAYRRMNAAFAEAQAAAVAAEEKADTAEEEGEQRKDLRLEILGQLPERLYQGDPLAIAILVRHSEMVSAAFAYFRRPEAIIYQRIPLVADGDGYYRGAVPADQVVPPSAEIFVEVVDRAGHTLTAGTASRPRQLAIDAVPSVLTPPGPGHSAVRGFFEFVDFNRFRSNDYYLVAEGDFTYRLGKWLWAVRTGFGVLYGKGGNKDELDKNDTSKGFTPCDPTKTNPPDPTCGREVGFNYGYVESEFHIGKYVGIIARLLGGQTVQGPGIGAELRLRIGQETGTNLLAGGSFLKDIGALGLLQLEWNVIHNWPMSAAVIVTNQPIQESVGVRIVYQVGYRAKPWLQPALRIGYDARNISHGGLSVGLGLIMAW